VSITARPRRKLRSDGERSRHAILDSAVALATTEGLEGLSIGRLAQYVGIRKGGVYAHFGSKEELQLATIDVAVEMYQRYIVARALAEPDALARLVALCENFLAYVVNDTFPGGCFFASVTAEFDTRPGSVRDRLTELQTTWRSHLTEQYAAAQAVRQLSGQDDPAQGTFELNAYMHMANDMYVPYRDSAYIDRGRRSVADHVTRHRPAPAKRGSRKAGSAA
jgi:AcrR family transcriptional regulator